VLVAFGILVGAAPRTLSQAVSSPHPELVKQCAPHRVVLEVADPLGHEGHAAPVDEWERRRIVVEATPEHLGIRPVRRERPVESRRPPYSTRRTV
jgi:hypothetical protein